MHARLDHIAVLATDLALLGASAPDWLDRSAIERFESEGTLEQYLTPRTGGPSILLLEPVGPGPYERAMRTRGSGLHHVAWTVGDVRAAAERWRADGWLVHEISDATLPLGTAWLYRPGVPTLIELFESDRNRPAAAHATIELPAGGRLAEPDVALTGVTLTSGDDTAITIHIGGHRWRLRP